MVRLAEFEPRGLGCGDSWGQQEGAGAWAGRSLTGEAGCRGCQKQWRATAGSGGRLAGRGTEWSLAGVFQVGLINGTAHPLRIRSGTGVITLERHGMAGVKATHQHCDTLVVEGQEVEFVLHEHHSVSGFPPEQRGVLYVVSEKTAMVVPE